MKPIRIAATHAIAFTVIACSMQTDIAFEIAGGGRCCRVNCVKHDSRDRCVAHAARAASMRMSQAFA